SGGGGGSGGVAAPPRGQLSAPQAYEALKTTLSLNLTGSPVLVHTNALAADAASVVSASGASLTDVPASLVYVPTAGGVELAWRLNVQTTDQLHWYDAYVSAARGETLYANDWVDHISYNAFPLPTKSPDGGSRAIINNPADPVASPYGWHDTDGVAGAEYTDTRGNNVFAQEDSNADNLNGLRPDGGATLDFTAPLDLTKAPSTYQAAATTNLFYWTNLLHDIHYHLGFDEAAGNFQMNNYGRGGTGGDPLIADAQDGETVNNSHMSVPPEGQSPRMQMYLWNFTNPNRDADLDSQIVIHEYGHGVSVRLTGGPANSSALTALQSNAMNEGWSDWWAEMFTQTASDTKMGAYPLANYSYGQSPSGGGIRSYPYSFNMSTDPLTMNNYNGGGTHTEAHYAGTIWASALWDLNWTLIDKYGYSADLINGTKGNNLALQLVENGLKLQPANPTFLDGRDAILAADVALTGGQNQAEIWSAFARRGMGFSADDGGNSNAVVVTPAYDMPPSASISGTVFRDDDGNGLRGGAEPGLAGWTVYQDVNNNGALDLTTTTTFNSTDTPRAILDQGTSYSTLHLSGLVGTVTDVNVTLNANHTYDGQMYFTLISPSGIPVILTNYQGGSGDNFTNTVFDDEAATPIASGTAPFTGTFKPYLALSRVDGGSPNGDWKMRMDDAIAGETGTLLSWSIQITYGGGEPTTITDANGNYSFGTLPDATYHIREVAQPGFVQTAPAGGVNNVTVAGGQGAIGQNFANQPGTASATPGVPDLQAGSDTGVSATDDLTKLDNANFAGALQFDVPGTIAGATVQLFADGAPIGSAVATGATTTVVTSGTYDLQDGTHVITARQTEPGKSVSNPSAGLAVQVDTQGPGVTVNQHAIQLDPTSGSYIYFTAVFTETVADFVAGDITLGGTAGATSVYLPGGGTNTYDFAVSGMTGFGTVTASVAAGVATDAAGNANAASTSVDNTVTYTPPLPEIAVTGLGLDIVDGDGTQSVNDGTDFGAVVQNGAAITRTFNVSNLGSTTLTLGAVTLPAGYVLGADALVGSLAPGASDTFSVQLTTAAAGGYAGDISIVTNDADENPFNFRVSGAILPLVNTKPVIVSLVDSPDPVMLGSTLTLTANGVTDPDAAGVVTRVEFFRDSDNNASFNPATDALLGIDSNGADGWSMTADTTGYALGTNRYFARAYDGGLYSSTATATGTVNVAPTIGGIAASPATVFKGDNVTIDAAGVADSAPGTVSAVEFYRDVNGNGAIDVGVDTLLGSDTSSAGGWNKVASTSAFPVGTVTLLARSKDNNAAYSPTVATTVFIDAKPTIGTLADSPDPLIPGNALTLTAGSVADSDGTVALVVYYRDANANNAVDPGIDLLLGTVPAGGASWALVVPGSVTAAFPTGLNTYLARAQDNLGAWSTARTSPGNVSNPPTVATLTPTPAAVNKGSNLTLVATGVADPDAGQSVASVTFYRDSNANGVWDTSDSALVVDSTPGDGWSWTGSTSTFASGNLRFFARAKDNVGLFSTVPAMTIVAINALPVVTITATPLNYALGAAATLVSSATSISDANSLDFAGGSLLVQFTNGTGAATDRLTIRNQGVGVGQIGLSGANVTYGGAVIGTWAGGGDGSSPLLVNFNALVTPAIAQALARNVLYQSTALPGSGAASKTVSFTIDDGDGGLSLPGVRTINVA
ncbi:MAG: M36 family metallopeptidase, partial [Planctomycetota bacterium]|nr:M36 family metallopeptidase [Planctomycetota bacterium]